MNFLSLTNRILKAFNETQLTSATFPAAYGFYAEAQDDINRAYFDIYTEEDTVWPFAYTSQTIVTTPGVQQYTLNPALFSVNWDSFNIIKPQITVSVMALTGNIVTVTTNAPHQMIVGDNASFFNVNDSTGNNTYYNSNLGPYFAGGAPTGFTVLTVPTLQSFTFSVPTSAPMPIIQATSYVVPPYQAQQIGLIDYNTYQDSGQQANDINGQVPMAVPTSYNQPATVVRMPDNSITLTPVPDRMYTIQYYGFFIPSPMVNYTDIPTIPSAFEQVLVDKALHYAYMFRDNLEQAQVADDRYTKNVNKMRRILIPQTENMRFEGV